MKFATLATACFGFIVCAATPVAFASDGRNLTTVNGSVEATAGQTYDTVSTVNGEVRVGRGATVEAAKTVNGEVEIESDARVGTVSTVNGALDIGEGATVTHEASTVNGELSIAQRSHVGGDVSTVSGEIELKGAQVAGSVSTVNGNIELTEGARVRGNLVVKRPNSGWNKHEGDPVKVRICATCVVEGELRFERPVELRVENGAKIGKVIGDSVKRL